MVDVSVECRLRGFYITKYINFSIGSVNRISKKFDIILFTIPSSRYGNIEYEGYLHIKMKVKWNIMVITL